MHSANRAKQRLRSAASLKEKEVVTPTTSRSRVPSRRSLSSDRSRNGRKGQIGMSPKTLKSDHQQHHQAGPGSDSGLSGLDPASEAIKKAPSPDSVVDSGRRSQSLEILSDDLRSMTLSTPSSPSPRPPQPPKNNRGHVHFMSVDNGRLNHAEIVRKMVVETDIGTLRKSNSIPVHLTVSSNNEEALPPRLRPYNPIIINCPTSEHEPDCASFKKKWSSSQTLPDQFNGCTPRRGPSTPTSDTVSSLQKKKFRVVNNGYNSLPRNSLHRERSNGEVARSRSSASLSSETPRRPPSAASMASVASASSTGGKRSQSRTGSRQGKTMNASMSIWQIQKELKRGEMVQGVLHLGSLGGGGPRISFGSRIQEREREQETCICAPVVIGGKNGHMEWKRM